MPFPKKRGKLAGPVRKWTDRGQDGKKADRSGRTADKSEQDADKTGQIDTIPKYIAVSLQECQDVNFPVFSSRDAWPLDGCTCAIGWVESPKNQKKTPRVRQRVWTKSQFHSGWWCVGLAFQGGFSGWLFRVAFQGGFSGWLLRALPAAGRQISLDGRGLDRARR